MINDTHNGGHDMDNGKSYDIIITAGKGELILTAQNANGDGWLGLNNFAPAGNGRFVQALGSYDAPVDEAATIALCAGWDNVKTLVSIDAS